MKRVEGERFEGNLVLLGDEKDRVVRVVVEKRKMTIDDHEQVVDDSVSGAWEPIPGDVQVRVVLVGSHRGRSSGWAFRVPDRATGEALLRCWIGEDVERTLTADFTRQPFDPNEPLSRKYRFLAFDISGVTVLGIGLSVQLPSFQLAAIFVATWPLLLSPYFLFRRLSRTRIFVGSDGVLRKRPLRQTLFFPHSRIRNVVHDASGLFLDLEGGAHARLAFPERQESSKHPFGLDGGELLLDLVATKIRAALADRARTAATATDARRNMPIAKWMGEVRAAPQNVPSYRVAPTRDHDHEAVFEDPKADVVTRACAAFALRAREGNSVVPRLRVAAATSASPRLRVALEKIAQGAPDSEIAKAIEKLR